MKKFATFGILSAFLIAAFGIASPVTAAPALNSASPASDSASVSVAKRFKAKKRIRIMADDSNYGKMLYSRNGQAIYIFDKDKRKRSRCYGQCARDWPPVLTKGKGKPRAVRGVKKKLLGTTKRRGGARQVTYAGKPLYYYYDERPGQVFCHNVFLNGGLWLVIHPNGKVAD